MSSIVESLMDSLSGNTAGQLSSQIGADPAATARAIQASIPLLMGALASNSQQPAGAQSLLGALDRDHDGSVLDDVAGFFSRGSTTDGAGILGHVFGNRRDDAQTQVAEASGLSRDSAGRLLMLLAPMILGALGKARRQKNLDAGGLGDLLGRERQVAESKTPSGWGGLTSFLDRDGDGSVMDDAARIGAGVLGNMMRRS